MQPKMKDTSNINLWVESFCLNLLKTSNYVFKSWFKSFIQVSSYDKQAYKNVCWNKKWTTVSHWSYPI